MKFLLLHASWLLGLTLLPLACSSPANSEAKFVAPNPCRDGAVRPNPLIVEWPTSLRSDLEMLRAEGLVAVKWKGCDIEILQQCHLPGGYTYRALTPKHDVVRIYNDTDLQAQLPFYGARFGGELKQSGELKISMDIVGVYHSHTPGITELRGDCREATHVVTSMNIGAFEFFSEDKNAAGGGAELGGAKLTGVHRSGKEMLTQDGDMSKCAEGTTTSTEPPQRCTATLRIEMRPIAARAATDDNAPTLDGPKRRHLQSAPASAPSSQ